MPQSLRFCSLATYAAARAYLQTRDITRVPAIITGVVESHVERELRAKLQTDGDTLCLREDLGLDSLCMMEIVLIFDDVLQVTISNDELSRLRTLGDVQRCFQNKVRSAGGPLDASGLGGNVREFVDPSRVIGALSVTQTSA